MHLNWESFFCFSVLPLIVPLWETFSHDEVMSAKKEAKYYYVHYIEKMCIWIVEFLVLIPYNREQKYHPSTDQAPCCLTPLIKRKLVHFPLAFCLPLCLFEGYSLFNMYCIWIRSAKGQLISKCLFGVIV